ncbi:MAG: PHB depolymerase family esterase [Archangium sp.]
MRISGLIFVAMLAGCAANPGVDGGTGGGDATGGGATGGGATGGGSAPGGGAAGGGSATGGGATGGGATGGGGATVVDAGLAEGEHTGLQVPGFSSRDYDLVVPAVDGGAHPAVILIHGGGGNRNVARRTTCPNADTTSPQCFVAMAVARGFYVIIPDGTGAVLRTWNSGGGSNGWQCVSGPACTNMVNEQQYFSNLLTEVGALVPLEPNRVYAAGLSNGGSMSERLACQFPEVAGIASIGSGNQWSTTNACTRSASVIEIHGTADPCWNWDGGPASCADPNPGSKISVPDTLAVWSRNNGCDGGEAITTIPDSMNDGTTTLHHVYSCGSAALELYEVLDGGHTWPGGASSGNGATATDWSANEVILEFFSTH